MLRKETGRNMQFYEGKKWVCEKILNENEATHLWPSKSPS